MALIQINADPDIFYDTQYEPDFWYKQSPECIAFGQNVIDNDTPISEDIEPCRGGEAQRRINGVWEKTTNTGTFSVSVTSHYFPNSSETHYFEAKETHDSVVLTQL